MQNIGKKSIRKISFNIVYNVFFNKAKLNDMILHYVDTDEFDDRDKAFIKYECTGVVEKYIDIDKIISEFSNIKISKLDKTVLIALRIAIFEMLYMDKVPSFAIINEYVNIVKNKSSYKDNIKPSTKKLLTYGNFVNAILRNIDKKYVMKKDDTNRETFVSEKIEKKCFFRILNNSISEVLEELKSNGVGFEKYSGDLKFNYAKVYSVNNYKNILKTDNFKNGNIFIADPSSIYLTDILCHFIIKECENQNIKILDTCAAPGGKIIGIYDILKKYLINPYYEARDINDKRIISISENLKRMGIKDIVVLNIDATIYNEDDKNKFNIVICDVPCSGLGVIDKKPDIMLNNSIEKLNSLLNIQKSILNTSSKYVVHNGLLSYSTCTTTKEENEDIVNSFLDRNVDFKKIYEKRIDRSKDADGFYICIMKKI